MFVDRRERLAVPGHPAPQHLEDVRDGTGTCFGRAAANDDAVRVQAVHVHVAIDEQLQLGGILLRIGLTLANSGAGKLDKLSSSAI